MTFDARPPLEGHITETVYPGWGLFRKALPYAGKLAALMGQAALSQQMEQQENANPLYFTPQQKQAALNALYPLSGIQMNQLQRYSPYISTQPQRLTPPPSQLGMNSIHNMEEAKRRADALAQRQNFQNPPDIHVAVSKARDPYEFVPPQLLTQPHFQLPQQVDIVDLEKPEQSVKMQGYPHELSEKQWKDITKAFHEMPLTNYEDIRKKDNMRELLTAKKEKKTIDWSIDADTKALFDEWNKKYALRPEPVNPYQVPYRKLNFKGGDLNKDAILREVTRILGYKPLLTKDGYVIIGRQAYGLYEATDVAKVAAAYRKIYGRVLPSLPYPTTPPDQVLKGKERSVYPDVTNVMNQHLKDIVQDVEKIVHAKDDFGQYLGNTISFFGKSFPDNAVYDIQVNYGLPGQQLPEGVYVEKIGEYQGHAVVKTVDQRAIFRGQVVHAGYLSNYAYGYAIAAASWHKGMTDTGAFFAAEKGGEIKILDSDKPYFHAGYEAFWKDHPEYDRKLIHEDLFKNAVFI